MIGLLLTSGVTDGFVIMLIRVVYVFDEVAKALFFSSRLQIKHKGNVFSSKEFGDVIFLPNRLHIRQKSSLLH
jgi:hypothetical protein